MNFAENERLIGKRLLEARKKKGMTQQALADKTGIKTTAISRYENSKKTPSLITLASFALALDVTIDYLFFGDDAERPISTAADEEEIIANCLFKLWELGVLVRAEVYFNDFIDYTTANMLFPKRYGMQINRYYSQLDDFEQKKESYADKEGYLKHIKGSFVQYMKTDPDKK